MNNIYIVGSGIIGLSIAEYFSRTNKNVSIISNKNPLAGSYAAAANLATKGQLFGRDTHFQMKLEAKKIIPLWINNLLEENAFTKKINIDDIFKIGLGADIFYNQTDRDKHLKRVLQNKEDLMAQNFPLDTIIPQEEKTIIYKDEAWVDAKLLLDLLQSVLKQRGVTFTQKTFSKSDLHEISAKKEKKLILFCAGAWTKQLLLDLELPLPDGFNKLERLTIGSTFVSQHMKTNVSHNFVLYEKIAEGLKQKVTLSGNSVNQYISSSSVKIKLLPTSLNASTLAELNKKNSDLIKLAKYDQDTEELLIEKIGLRVGFGHSEILIEPIYSTGPNITAIACCGAHKSGFLFAPVLGQKVELITQNFLK